MLRVGTCSVLTERAGEKTGHIMIAKRVYCKQCPRQKRLDDLRSFCKAEHVTYRRCNSCGFEQRDWRPCDHYMSRYAGGWPHYGYCDRKGVELREKYYNLMGNSEKGSRWLCKQHFPENIEARAEAKAKREAAKYEADYGQLN